MDFKGHLPLWSLAWDSASLKKKHRQIGDKAFEQGYRMRAYTDDDFSFPNFKVALSRGEAFCTPSEIPRNHRCVVGVDLASHRRRGNAIVVGGLMPSGIKYPVDVQIIKATSPQVAAALSRVCEQWNPEMIVVENNAYQTALAEWIEESKQAFPFWDRIEPFFTGKNKVDPEFGITGMDVDFKHGSWIIPREMHPDFSGHTPSCDCGPCTLIRQIQTHPNGEEIDALMAFWFMREGCRKITRGRGISVEEEIRQPRDDGAFDLGMDDVIL